MDKGRFTIYAKWNDDEDSFADLCQFVIDQFAYGNPDAFCMLGQVIADKYVNKFFQEDVWIKTGATRMEVE